MPFLAPVIAAVGSAIAAVGTAIATVGTWAMATLEGALAAVVGKTAAFAISGLIAAAAPLALSLGLSSLATPRIGEGGGSLDFRPNRNAGWPFVAGTTGTAGVQLHLASSGTADKNKFRHWFLLLAMGPDVSVDAFYANEVAVTFASYVATSEPYAGKMWLTTTTGANPDVALTQPSGTGSITEWTGEHKLSGWACARWVLEYDQEVYVQGQVAPLFKVSGPRPYDPREDSTQPGGSGSQRIDDQSTWDGDPRNPWLQALSFIVGWRDEDEVVIGLGEVPDLIDVASFTEAANLSDDNAWFCDFGFSSADDPWEVLKAFAQAGGGEIISKGAKIGCFASVIAVSAGTITDADIMDAESIPTTQALATKINGIWPSFQSVDHFWKMTPLDDAIVVDDYVTADDGLFTRQLGFPGVQDATQVAQLTLQGLFDAREINPIVLTLAPAWNALNVGDVIDTDAPEFMLNGLKLRILKKTRDYTTGCPKFVCRTETEEKYALALAATGTAPEVPVLTAVDPYNIPAPSADIWTVTGIAVTGPADTIPLISVSRTGSMDNPAATEVIVEYRPSTALDDGVWRSWNPGAALPQSFEIGGVLTSLTDYDVSLRYRTPYGLSGRLIFEDVTAGEYDFTGATPIVTPDPTPAWGNISVASSSPASVATSAVAINGITSAIELAITFTGAGVIAYRVNGGVYIDLTSGDSFFVSPTNTVQFKATRTGSAGTNSGTVTVTNVTDSSTTLDTFTYSATVVSGVTPDAVNWANISGAVPVGNANQTFSGLSTAITLRFDFISGGTLLWYSKNNASLVEITPGTTTVSVSNGDTLKFSAGTEGDALDGTVAVVNTSDGDTVLDTFTVYVTA